MPIEKKLKDEYSILKSLAEYDATVQYNGTYIPAKHALKVLKWVLEEYYKEKGELIPDK